MRTSDQSPCVAVIDFETLATLAFKRNHPMSSKQSAVQSCKTRNEGILQPAEIGCQLFFEILHVIPENAAGDLDEEALAVWEV